MARHRRRKRHNPPMARLAGKVFGGLDLTAVLAVAGGLVIPKLAARFIPSAIADRVPRPVLDVGVVFGSAYLIKKFMNARIANLVLASGLAPIVVSMVSRATGGLAGDDLSALVSDDGVSGYFPMADNNTAFDTAFAH